MAAAFTEQQERLAGKDGNRQTRIGNGILRLRLFFTVMSVLPAFVFGCRDAMTVKPLRKETMLYTEADAQLHNENGIFTKNHQPFTGTVYSLSSTKKDTIVIGSFINGKEDGEWRKYFVNGQMMERRYFTNGKKTGVYTGWWPNGKQRLLYHFADGEYEGTCKDWAEDGTMTSEMNYHGGHEEGPQKQYYESGKIKANYVIKNGRRYGLLGTKNCVNVSDSIFKKG